MSFFRVTSGSSAIEIADLGITIPASTTVVLSSQFSINDLYLSADLESLIISGDLDVEIDYGTGWSTVLAADYTNRDALAAFMNIYEITNSNTNENLVSGSDSSSLHNHNSIYHTKTELNGTGGAALIGVNNSGWTVITGSTAQAALTSIDSYLSSFDLDDVYANDSDGILNVNGTNKPLNLRSNNTNDVVISRWNTSDSQDALRLDVSANELLLGALVSGALSQLDVRILSNLIIDGNLTVTGTVTDTSVDELNITNSNIRLRDGATSIPGADAYIEVERGTSGNDARLLWSESIDRWRAGIVGDLATIALIEKDEVITGIWEFQGGAAADPSMYLTNKASAPTANLGTSGQIPVAMIANTPAYYDKSNSRNKWLSYYRMHLSFTGRDNQNNSNEYLRAGEFTSNQSSYRLLRNMTLIGISAQTNGNGTWNVRVRKNGVNTNLATLSITAAAGAQSSSFNVDFNAGDKIEVFCDGSNINRPFVVLEFAERF